MSSPYEIQDTDAGHRGGLVRSSREVSVMGNGAKGLDYSVMGNDQPLWEESLKMTKSFDISKQVVWRAYEQVKANKGAAGVDEQSMQEFERNLKGICTKSGIACHLAAICHRQ